jgi:xanthine/uracil permease
MAYDINEMPPMKEAIVLAFQHLFAMFGATILVPILVNAAAGAEVLTIPVALVTSGIGTLIYIFCTKGRSPVYLGSSFAFIVPVAAAYTKAGIAGAMTNTLLVMGSIYVFYRVPYAEAVGVDPDALMTMIAGVISFNGVIEAVVGAIIVYLVGIVLDKIKPAGVYAGKEMKIKAVTSETSKKQMAQ